MRAATEFVHAFVHSGSAFEPEAGAQRIGYGLRAHIFADDVLHVDDAPIDKLGDLLVAEIGVRFKQGYERAFAVMC